MYERQRGHNRSVPASKSSVNYDLRSQLSKFCIAYETIEYFCGVDITNYDG